VRVDTSNGLDALGVVSRVQQACASAGRPGT
jgi:hypothetical protein